MTPRYATPPQPVPANPRVAVRDTVIPRGGGTDGQSPVLIARGTPIVYNVSGLYRQKDIYGPTLKNSDLANRTLSA